MINLQEPQTFIVERDRAERSALHTLSADLSRASWIVDSSNGVFAFIVGFGVLVVIFNAAIIASTASYITALLILVVSLTFVIRLRLKRRTYLDEAIGHYTRERITICETGITYRQPLYPPYPFEMSRVLDTFGRYETYEWSFTDVSRFTVCRTKTGLVTTVELHVGNAFFTFDQFYNKDRLVELLIDRLQTTQKIEELPRLFPIWTRAFLVACGVGVIAIIILVSSHS